MGRGRRRRGWLYTLKKIFSCQSSLQEDKREKDQNNGESENWLQKQRIPDSENSNVIVPSSTNNPHVVEEEDVKLVEAENEQSRHAYSVALATAAAAEAAVAAAQAAAEVVRLTQNLSSKTKEEIAAIKIQTAFRGYMARRALRALRGLVRLKTVVGGQSVKRQAVSTLKCMQNLCRVQYQVRARRTKMSEQNLCVQRQIQQKEREKSRESIGENWDDSILSKDRVEENLRNRQEAATRRERALAYSYSHQQTWRNNTTSNPANQTFMDPNNPRWGWIWLERWMPTDKEPNSDQASLKTNNTTRSVSTKADNLKTQFVTPHKQGSRPPSRQSPSTPKSTNTIKLRPPSPKSRGTTTNDSNSINSAQSERCHRYSIASSSLRDDESLYSCPVGGRSYMAPTESTRAKSRLSSPLGSEKRVGTPDKGSGVGSAKKRLSFSGSPGLRRHSGPPKIDFSSVKDINQKS